MLFFFVFFDTHTNKAFTRRVVERIYQLLPERGHVQKKKNCRRQGEKLKQNKNAPLLWITRKRLETLRRGHGDTDARKQGQ